MFQYVEIKGHHAGFGMWDTTISDGEPYEDASDLLHEIYHESFGGEEVYELGVDELPDGIADIRGTIYNQPERVFVHLTPTDVVDGDGNVTQAMRPQYFGITELKGQGGE
jgi:hypothetical protein